jgi:hypothetical protein
LTHRWSAAGIKGPGVEAELRSSPVGGFPPGLLPIVASYLAERIPMSCTPHLERQHNTCLVCMAMWFAAIARVVTLAGSGRNAHVDGDALTVASFGNPFGIACSRTGNSIYVSDHSGFIRRLQNGRVTTIAGIVSHSYCSLGLYH